MAQRGVDEQSRRRHESSEPANVLPDDGCLVWRTSDGLVRELDPEVLTGLSDRTCPDCDGGAVATGCVREHRACGYVGLDGFQEPAGSSGCPKCGETDPAFPVVARVLTCLECGRVLGSPP